MWLEKGFSGGQGVKDGVKSLSLAMVREVLTGEAFHVDRE